MDVENYLEYFAMNIYIGNEDWPHNNYRLYRYYPADGEGSVKHLLTENGDSIACMDFSFGIYGTGPTTDF
jgi:hypothetical protein